MRVVSFIPGTICLVGSVLLLAVGAWGPGISLTLFAGALLCWAAIPSAEDTPERVRDVPAFIRDPARSAGVRTLVGVSYGCFLTGAVVVLVRIVA